MGIVQFPDCAKEIMDTLKEHSKILREQSRLLHEHFGSVPPSAPPVEEWVSLGDATGFVEQASDVDLTKQQYPL